MDHIQKIRSQNDIRLLIISIEILKAMEQDLQNPSKSDCQPKILNATKLPIKCEGKDNFRHLYSTYPVLKKQLGNVL